MIFIIYFDYIQYVQNKRFGQHLDHYQCECYRENTNTTFNKAKYRYSFSNRRSSVNYGNPIEVLPNLTFKRVSIYIKGFRSC